MSGELEIPISTINDTIYSLVQVWSVNCYSLPSFGRPSKIFDRAERNIVRKVKKNPRLTRYVVQKHLKLPRYIGMQEYNKKNTSILRDLFSHTMDDIFVEACIHVKNHLEFTEDHLEIPAKIWDFCTVV